MELSADDGGTEAGPGAGGGQLRSDKTPEITPLTALKLAELAKDIFPEGVINVLFGRGKTVGDPLTAHVKVRMVSLTGSIATGAHIIGHTASSIKRTHMELGGKAPVIVFDDADIDAVVDGVRTFGFYNAGQTARPPAGSTPSRVSMTSWWRNLGRRWPA